MRTLALLLLSALPLFAQGDLETLMLLRPPVSAPATIPGPDSITGLKLWFKPESLSTSNNGDAVGRWVDSSGNGWDARPLNAGQSPYYTNSALGTNGGIYFDGTDDLLLVSNAANGIFRNASSGTIVAVHRMLESTGNRMVVFFTTTGSTSTRLGFGRGLSGNYDIGIGGRRLDADAFAAVANAAQTNVWYAGMAVVVWSSSDAYVYTNGVLAASSTSFQTDGNTSDTDSARGVIGSFSGTPLKGWVSEGIVYDKALSEGERTTLNTYLTNKYGVYPW